MEYFFAIAIPVIVILFIVYGKINEQKAKKKLYDRLKNEYGKLPDMRLHEIENGAAGYLRNNDVRVTIDEITENDLNLDDVFDRLNYCVSSLGAEYLYYVLRYPEEMKGKEEAFDRKVEMLSKDEEGRLKLRMAFAALGSRGKYSLYDFLNYLGELKNHGIFRYILKNILLIASIVLIFFNDTLGVMATISMVIYSIIAYAKEKSEIEPYIVNMSLILSLLRVSKTIPYGDFPVFSEENEKVKELNKKLGKFARYGRVFFSNRGTGSIMESFMMYVRMLTHSDIILFRLMLNEIKENKDSIKELAKVIGYGDFVISVSYYRASLPYYTKPVFTDTDRISAVDLYHPLLAEPVVNSFSEDKCMLLTGSNASGKSTFLKTVALCELLARAIYTCPAREFTSAYYRVVSSMALKDDIIGGESYYMAEIKSLKRILDEAKEGERIICFIDEVLRGTNTVERISASTEVLNYIAENNIKCFAATHDIELTSLLAKKYSNYHFEETITDDDVIFDYILREGKSRGRNAIALLRLMGYPENVTDNAYKRAETFLESGVWS